MANTKVALANIALDLIGAATIMSFDDDSNEAKIIKRMYEESKREVIRSHTWNCVRKRVILAPLTTSPPFGYGNTFKLPSDLLRVLPLGSLVGLSYEIEERNLLCNEDSIELHYLADITDVTIFDSLLTKAIALKLAADICYRLVQSDALTERMESKYDKILRRAKTINAQEQQEQALQADAWLDSRLQNT